MLNFYYLFSKYQNGEINNSNKKDENIEIYVENSLDDVINVAYNKAKSGQVVLFSPASASFDMFKNFADRGIQFKEMVNKL